MEDAQRGAPNDADVRWDRDAPGDGEAEIKYNADTDTYRTSFYSDDESASMAVISTVAALAGTDPVDLPPLYSVVDADALDALVDPNLLGSRQSDVQISFAYNGHEVTVHSYGIITARRPAGS